MYDRRHRSLRSRASTPRSRRGVPLIKLLASAIMLVATLALFAPAAYAAPMPRHPRANRGCGAIVNTGGGSCRIVIVPLSAQQQAQLAAKQASAGAYQSVQPALAINNPVVRPIARALNVVQVSQQTNYYCGPASAYEILQYQMIHNGLGSTTGPQGETLSQSTLAGSSYLQTDEYDGTNWSPYVMAPTLNAWLHTSYYVAQPGSGVGGGFSTKTWELDLRSDIDGGWSIAGNVVESAGGPHLVGHPTNETIYHWIAVMGYTNYGDYTTYVDSVHGDTQFWSWAANVPAQSTIDSGSLTTMLNGRGYIW